MKSIFTILFFLIFKSFYSNDSLKVYIIGTFGKGETFKIHTPKKTYLISNEDKQNAYRTWYFVLETKTSFKDGDVLPIIIEKKRGKTFYNVELYCYFQKDRKYFVLWKDYRQSNKFPFIELWTNNPINSEVFKKDFWDESNNSNYIPEEISNENKYDYFFLNLFEWSK